MAELLFRQGGVPVALRAGRLSLDLPTAPGTSADLRADDALHCSACACDRTARLVQMDCLVPCRATGWVIRWPGPSGLRCAGELLGLSDLRRTAFEGINFLTARLSGRSGPGQRRTEYGSWLLRPCVSGEGYGLRRRGQGQSNISQHQPVARRDEAASSRKSQRPALKICDAMPARQSRPPGGPPGGLCGQPGLRRVGDDCVLAVGGDQLPLPGPHPQSGSASKSGARSTRMASAHGCSSYPSDEISTAFPVDSSITIRLPSGSFS